MKNIGLMSVVLIVFLFCGACAQNNTKATSSKAEDTTKKAVGTVVNDLNAADFQAKMANKEVVIMDVRTDEEVALGIIPGAIQLDYRASDFSQKVAALDKDKEYLVYCRSGGRSSDACNDMKEMGFTKLNNLLGGYSEWPYK